MLVDLTVQDVNLLQESLRDLCGEYSKLLERTPESWKNIVHYTLNKITDLQKKLENNNDKEWRN